jgi:multiple sugar transport system permease protein
MATIGPSTAPPTAPALAAAVDPAIEEGSRKTTESPLPSKWTVGRVLITLLLVGFAALFLYPLVWLIASSLKPASQVFDNRLVPKTWRFDNYAEVWDQLPLLHWMFNSIAIALIAAAAVAISSSVVAFGFAYFRFPGRNLLFGLVLATLMLPASVTMVPTYLIWKQTGFLGTWVPLFGMNLFGSAFYIFLQRQFYLGLPRELFEAARMDGDNFFTMFWRIALPLARPALVVAFVFEFKASWNDLLTPLIYLQDPEKYTLPRGLKAVVDEFGQAGEMNWEVVIAALVISTIPMILVFFAGQRYFVEGIATEGRKG